MRSIQVHEVNRYEYSRIKEDSEEPSELFFRGQCHLYNDSPELALDDFERSLSLLPDIKAVLEDRLMCILYLAQACALIEDWERLAVACEQALAIDPDCAQAYAFRLEQRKACGDWEGATRDVFKLQKLDQELFVATITQWPELAPGR